MSSRILFGALVALATIGLLAPSASAVQFAEARGDFYYDSDGRFVGVRHAEMPVDLERRPMSHREKFELMGIRLPDAPVALEPRRIPPKPARVADHDGLSRDKIIVKFREGIEVRLRRGRLLESGSTLPDVEEILARHPEAALMRLFSVEERILDENRVTGELISGRALADLNNYYLLRLPSPGPEGVALAEELLALDVVETAYLEPEAKAPACSDIAPTTPLWEANQFYLDAAPDGVNAWFARAYHAGGDGPGPGFWVADLEWNWCLDHEDLDIDSTDVINGATVVGSVNHGTAVLGEYGACENDYGMTGISPDISLKMSDFDSEPSWASNIAYADAVLVTGEVMLLEIHISGPDTGTTCVCNCDDFEYVPVEYQQASYDAIAAATANGIVVVEAAGNGSVDLDWAVYASRFDRSFRDSGAILVGAGEPGSHDPECWTNHGDRVDVHGYGSGIYTTGYGYQWNQIGCNQDYDNDFGGTSGASPIVVGASVALQGIANAKYGYDLTCLQMRDLLQVGGTPQGTPATSHIGPMPDLADAINALEPDLTYTLFGGWSHPVVPRATNDATVASCPLGAGALPGNVAGTWWNLAWRNVSALSPTINNPATLIHRNNTGLWSGSANLGAGQAAAGLNYGSPDVVKGGRHTVLSRCDIGGVEDESNEFNQDYARQFIWSGLSLAAGSPVSRTDDPPSTSSGSGPWFNAEGFSGTTGSGYWYAFGVMPEDATDDFDVRLNTEAPTNVPQAGFGSYEAYSSDASGEIDFVILDRNEVPSGTYWASVLNHTGAGAANKKVEFVQDEGTISTPGTYGPYTLAAGDLLNLHEISMTPGQEYRVTVQVVSGAADYGLSVYDTYSGYFSKFSTMPGGFADDGGAYHSEFAVVDPDSSGYHGAAVWKARTADLGQTLTYRVIVSLDPNLTDAVPTGWHGPVVPRNTTDATTGWVPLPDSLIGNQTTTSFNFSTYNQGPNSAAAPWLTRLWLDDVPYWTGTGSTIGTGSFARWINTSQGYDPYSLVRGGRHHLRLTADVNDQVLETFEDDNDYTEWFVWTPLPLADGYPITRDAPPIRDPLGFGPYFSSDGYRAPAPPTGPYWAVVGALPVAAADDYDIRLFAPSTGSKDGFGTYLAYSTAIAGAADYAIVNYNTVGRLDADIGVLNHSAGTGDMVVQMALAPYLGVYTGGQWELGPFTIGANEVVDAWEIQIPSPYLGQNVYLSLHNLTENSNLDLGLYAPTVEYADRFGYLAFAEANGTGGDEHLGPIPITDAGYYLVTVVKSRSADLPRGDDYRLVLSTESAVDAPQIERLPTTFALAAPRPNPFTGETLIRCDVPAEGGPVRVAVHDLAGRRVATLLDGSPGPGRHTVTWTGRNDRGGRVAAGIYFVRMESADFRDTKKVIRLR